MRRGNWPPYTISGALVLAMAGVPALLGVSDFTLLRLEHVIALVLVVIGLNIVTGYAGQLSLGPSAVFGVAAYTSAVLANEYPQHVGLLLMCLAAVAAAAAVGLFAGVPALRVSGFYLGMVTLYLALLVPLLVGTLSITGRHNGISLEGNLDFTQDLSGLPLYETTLGAMLAAVAVSALLLHSRVGRRFVTLHTSEVLAESLGIAGYRTKLLAFLLSAIPAGIGGALYVYSQQLVSPGSIDPLLSFSLLAAAVIGGLGTVWGPVVGGALVFGLDQFLSGFAQYELIVFGGLLIGIVLLLPEGLAGARPATVMRRLRRRPSLVSVSAPLPRHRADTALPLRRCTESTGDLVLSGVAKRFGGVVAVDGVDLLVRPGTLHALIGPNGSGKTTLLNVASGFHRADRGRITVGDRVLRGGASDVARSGLARTFQTPKLINERTVLDNLVPAADAIERCSGVESVFRLPRGVRAHRRARERALECLRRLDLESVAATRAAEVPHGTQRLVELARAVAADPLFVLLDEPAAGLSPAETAGLEALLRDLAAAGVGVLLVEHNVPFVLRLADEVTVLHRGRRIAHGAPDRVRADPEVTRVYLGAA